ncbi:hypothetical protein [Nocardia sp. AG03]|uniref:hypothetical protein n=1 Tax=Nocardia sp. AG03 TaxID=3025312 RepID=UPI0024189833|nr:hypothetical protein [Nocardia sp. AG03]
MNIDGQAEFEYTGDTYLQVRDCLQVMCQLLSVHRDWFERSPAKGLENPAGEFDILIEQGYLEADGTTATISVRNPETCRYEQIVQLLYRPTSKGYTLANASAAKPVHRATAETSGPVRTAAREVDHPSHESARRRRYLLRHAEWPAIGINFARRDGSQRSHTGEVDIRGCSVQRMYGVAPCPEQTGSHTASPVNAISDTHSKRWSPADSSVTGI